MLDSCAAAALTCSLAFAGFSSFGVHIGNKMLKKFGCRALEDHWIG